MIKYILLSLCLLSFSCINAQSYSSGHLHAVQVDTMSHDSTTCQGFAWFHYHITVDSSFAGDSVIIVDTYWHALVGTYYNTAGSSPWIFDESATGTGSYDWIVPGQHMYFGSVPVKIAGTADTIPAATYSDSLVVTNPCGWSLVSGRVYIDNNNNCAYDGGDLPLHSFPLSFVERLSSPSDSLSWGTTQFGDTSMWYAGEYNFSVQTSWMINYTVSMPPAFAFIFPRSSCFSGTSYVLDTINCTTADFPLQCSASVDVMCGALMPPRVRAHHSFYMQPYVSNTGCDIASGLFTLVLDSRVHYDASMSSVPADSVHGDTLFWNYYDLSSLSGGAYWNNAISNIYLTPDSLVTMGDTLCFFGYTNVPSADVDASNNSFSLCVPVVYSYDPNSKSVSPAGSGSEGYIPASTDTLTYKIHFQNTGSDYAENIRVVDTLNPNFNMHTLKILGTSHNMTPKWVTANVVEFDFNEIFLPDSTTDQAASNGQLSFSIALNPDVAHGTKIKNTGYIYFDNNPPVITNSTLNTIALDNAVPKVAAAPVRVYPNPTQDIINIENLGGGTLSIVSMSGELLMQRTVTGSRMSLDISSLPGGIYILKAVNDSGVSTTKITKF